MVRELQRKSMFFRFANRYVAEHRADTNGTVTDDVLSAFRAFLEKEKFDFQEDTEKKVSELRQSAEKAHYSKEIIADLDQLAAELVKEKTRGFDRYKDHIRNELTIELGARLRNDRGRIEASFKSDTQLRTALGLLQNQKQYRQHIGI
jgi:carboxyl-terminal processing protease